MGKDEKRLMKMALAQANSLIEGNKLNLDKMRESRTNPSAGGVSQVSLPGLKAGASGAGYAPEAAVSSVLAGEGGSAEEQALRWLIQKESSGKTTAKNPKSSAFGLGQLIKANRKAYAQRLGIKNPDTTDYDEQLAMMKAYIKERYGDAVRAKQFWERNQWY